jgi:hypothetical protein
MNKYKNITASALIKTGVGTLEQIIVNSHSSGTIKIWDQTSAATPVICNTITLGSGERFIEFEGLAFTNGLYITIGGTADITVVYS